MWGAFTVQPYTEVNSKRGVQYEAAFDTVLDAAGGVSPVSYLAFEVGDQDVLIKNIITQFTSEEIQVTVFEGPSGVSGGSEVSVYNLNDRDAVPDDVSITVGVSVTGEGTQVSPSTKSLGASAQGNRQASNIGQNIGVERVFAAGRTYLYKVENLDTVNDAIVSSTATWYQGEADF